LRIGKIDKLFYSLLSPLSSLLITDQEFKMKNQEIADILNRMGALLEMKEENVFKVRAYYKAAENIAALTEDIEDIKNQNRLSEIPGIGEALAEKITEHLETGRMSAYQKLIQEIPESVLDIVNIPSVGPKKAKLFFDQLKVKSVEELSKAIEAGRLQGLPGIKDKTIENIKRGIRLLREGQERMNIGTATQIADQFVAALKKLPEVKEIAAAGSLRRMRETIRDIDILIDSSNPKKVMDTFVHLPQVKTINAYGETKSSVMTSENVQVDLRVVEPRSFGAALLYFTGSKNFNIRLRQIAIKKNMKINEYGVFALKDQKEEWIASKTEEECLKALGLPYVPPELREDIGEEELFSGKPISKLIALKDIKGDLHVHSIWSDGRNTISQMAEAARRHGYQYVAISDHSPRLRVAGGVSLENLKKKKKEIDQLNSRLKDFRILFGTEVEIDTEGRLDYNEATLKEFDFVIAAIHSGFEQSRQKLTERLIKACQNKYVHAIAHPTGRHIGKRDSYNIDLKELCKVAVDTNTFLEINAFPIRLDLDSANIYFARSQGVKFTINSDSHATDHLKVMKFGVGIARRGWLRAEDVVNALSLKELEKAIEK